MGTRALIGIIETEAAGNQILTSTYNHYDGYPSNLGVGLNKYYDELESAKKVANMGYISFLNPETGEIESKHNDPAEKTVLPDDFEEAMREVHSIADSMGADYVYLFDFDDMNWIDSKNYSTKNLVTSFEGTGIENQFAGFATFDGRPDPGEGDEMEIEEDDKDCKHTYKQIDPDGTSECTKCGLRNSDPSKTGEKVVKEGDGDVVAKAKAALKNMENLGEYIESLTNDIKTDGEGRYNGYKKEDWIEDYENNGFASYSMKEHIKTKWQYRAGIIK